MDSSELNPGDWFVVVGCGGLGQFAAQVAQAMGVNVIGVDVNDETLSVFSKHANKTFNSRTDPGYLDKIKALTSGGAHAVGVYSGSGAAYEMAPSLLRVNGLLMCVGIPQDPISISVNDLCIHTYRIKGESTSVPSRMQKAVDFIIKHNIIPEVEFRQLDELQAMCDELKAGKAQRRKVVVF